MLPLSEEKCVERRLDDQQRCRSASGSSDGSGGSSREGSSSSRSKRSRSPPSHAVLQAAPQGLGLGAVVKLQGLQKAADLNGRTGVVTWEQGSTTGEQRWEVVCFPCEDGSSEETRRLAVQPDKLCLIPHAAGAVKLRLRNVPSGYDTSLMREELDDEGFAGDESFSGLLHDESRGFCYLTAASERVAMQIICNFDGRRLERCGPGRAMPDSRLAQIVKLDASEE
eukprot:CAMPEP_0172819102 /NCGR_PEP_ID=MMETSP1075-20121228/14362_1 /TAXON_ID=2916 /ORGANISM="Ceratium fusus, Strain PA161109" /LENGTH=224 /DNA_ID=CAMNT_0013659565 /DNA_START=97 /DNA_END=769 /DNA_ORIENTATION=-